MQKAKRLKVGDKVAIVSLSSGMLGETANAHNLDIGTKRLQEFGLEVAFMPNTLKGLDYLQRHPEKRAEDLKAAFLDPSIKGIICAIGGDDTYRLLPYLMDDEDFLTAVKQNPKLFTGFSDTTINHLLFYKLGLSTYYGPSFVTDLADISNEMLPYTKNWFANFIEGQKELTEIKPSEFWYEERTDFSKAAVGTKRVKHRETRGYESLQGPTSFSGSLFGGCLDSFYDILTTTRYSDEKEICETYGLFPSNEQLKGKILFLETSEEKPKPEEFRKMLETLKVRGVFDVVKGVLFGKPQDEVFYEEYKQVIKEELADFPLSVVCNVNFGRAFPRAVLAYGIEVEVAIENQCILFMESLFTNK